MAIKKSFKGDINPAMNFISQSSREEETPKAETLTEAAKAPEGYKPNPLYVETKSRRLQLLLKPSLYEKIKLRADESGVSVNECAHTLLEAALK